MTNRLIDVHGYEDGMSPTGNPYNVPLSVANMLIYAGRASLSASNAVSGSPEDGFAGFTGWTAIPSMTIYQGKLVMHLHWVGGTGTAPTAGYVGPNKLVTIPADAVDMVWRMYQGEDTTEQGVAGTPVVGKSGWSPVPTLVADGARQVMHITWSGGTGTPPPDGFVGAGELVATAALAVNLKGESVAAGPHQHAVSDVAGLEAAMGAKADLVGGKLDLSQLPDIAVSDYLGVAATQAAMLALTGQKGDWCSRADNGKVYIITGADPAVVGGWTQLSYPVPTLDLPGMTTAATAGTVAQKTAHRDALGLGPIATMTLPEAQYAVSGGVELGFADVIRAGQGVSYSPSFPAPILDLNYEKVMALSGVETYTRAATDTYLDAAGNSQTAAINTPAFDRRSIPVLGWPLPRGLKCSGNGKSSVNISALLALLPAAEYTVVVDAARLDELSTSGCLVSLNDGSAANRVDVICNANRQAQGVVQVGGTLLVNSNIGALQTWYGRDRRIVLSCKAGQYILADTGRNISVGTAATAPATSALTTLEIGGSTYNASYFTGWIRRVRIYPVALSALDSLAVSCGDFQLACWGDSLTQGTGAADQTGAYPERIRFARYPAQHTYNGGVGGETSTQIKARFAADPYRKGWTTVIWVGRNNFANKAQVMADIAEMVAGLSHKRFIVMTVLNRSDEQLGSAAYTQIMDLNAAILAAYPKNSVDIRSILVTKTGGTGDAIANTATSDGLHLLSPTYVHVVEAVDQFLALKKWW
jgi:hypothetical protein